MTPVKESLRRNGKHMITLKIPHDLDGEKMARALAAYFHHVGGGNAEEVSGLSNRQVVAELIRVILFHAGSEGSYDEMDADDFEYLDEAREVIRRLFPKMASTVGKGWEEES